TISGQVGISKDNRGGGGNTHTFTVPQFENIYSVAEETSVRENDFYSGNFNFQHNFAKKGHKFEAMAYYSDHDEIDNEEEAEFYSDEQYNSTETYLDRVLTSELEKESEFRFKADYTLPISETGKIEAGVQSRIENEYEGNSFEDYDQPTDTWIINDQFTSSTDFKRGVHAAYSTYSNKLGEVEYMGGIRGEYTNREVVNSDVATTYALTRFDWFPTLHLSYGIKENNQLMASYSKRINRPRGGDLDPVPSYRNRYSMRIGNPDLQPEYTNSYELGFMKRFDDSYLSFETFRRVTDNKINRIETLGEDGIYYQTSDNFNKDYSTGLEVMGNINFTKWLLVNASITIFKYRLKGDLNGESIDRESTNWSGRMNTTFKFSPDSRMQIMANYRAPSISAQGESKAMFYTNVSYRQDFMKKKMTATISIQDPLGTGKYERETLGKDFKSAFRWTREPRVVMFTVSYKINNFKADNRDKNGQGGGNMNMGGEM
ncbi:MAG: TonB-dependent receptor, partial [Bacteroidetes bacterium]|nr:TonB-dependent receptor [Bacteroidota bacterium]